MIRKVLLALAVIAPWFVRKAILRFCCGAVFGKDSYVGHSFIDTRKLDLGEGARIGNLNSLRHVKEVKLGSMAILGNLNWISGLSHMTGVDEMGNYRSGRLILGEGAAITNRHYLDMHSDIEVGRMSLVAGVRSTLLTHSIDFATNRQAKSGIIVGAYSFLGTNCVVLPGTVVADHCIIAAGAVVKGHLEKPGCLYGGVPAKFLKEIPDGLPFFNRKEAFVE